MSYIYCLEFNLRKGTLDFYEHCFSFPLLNLSPFHGLLGCFMRPWSMDDTGGELDKIERGRQSI